MRPAMPGSTVKECSLQELMPARYMNFSVRKDWEQRNILPLRQIYQMVKWHSVNIQEGILPDLTGLISLSLRNGISQTALLYQPRYGFRSESALCSEG